MMRTNSRPAAAVLRVVALATAAFGWTIATVSAQTHTVHLIAAPFTKSVALPNGQGVTVPMWGYALDKEHVLPDQTVQPPNGMLDPDEQVSSPGPRITVPVGTASLAIVLSNQLPAATSLVIPGQAFVAAPVLVGGRVVSMTAEAAPGLSATYTFNSVKPGTFLYQSGSHQAVQIQMGLYGAVTQDAAAGAAYSGVPYAHDVVLLYSEIDRALHQAVADGTYGTPAGPTSTIDYAPTLFLINGQSYANQSASPAIAAGAANEATMIRFLNAGLRTHVPVLDNGTLSVVAEDGNKYPFARPQAAVLLAAGKTHDAIWTPAAAGDYPVYDRSLSLNAPGQGAAGMLAKLRVSAAAAAPGDPLPPAGAPVAVNDEYTSPEDTGFGANVLANDTGATSAELVTSTGSGTLSLTATGSFTYVPAPNFFGVDSFTYRAVNSTGSQLALAIITVSAVGDAPVARAQAVGVQATETVPVTLTASDADGDPLTFYLTTLPASGTVSRVNPVDSTLVPLVAADLRTGPGTGTAIPGGRVIYEANGAVPSASFAFVASDNAGTTASAAAAVAVAVHAVVDPADELLSPLSLNVVGSNGAAITGGFRWTLEEDRTYRVQPGVLDPKTLSVSFHASYMPVKQSGDETTLSDLKVDPSKRYFVSVLPKTGSFTNGGAAVGTGQTSVTVKVNSGPMPTAQIRVRVFQDNAALNGMWDTDEPGLKGFAVTIEDAGGRYGMSAAQQLMDAFGNQIGTTYQPCSGVCESYEVAQYGNGFVLSDDEGWALIQNLAPGKYGVKVMVPGGTSWIQTATIEGTRVIDAWVKPNEPTFFAEFGPPGPHAAIGFTLATKSPLLNGTNTVSGQVTNLHLSRPPDFQMFSGAPFNFTQPWVALNAGATGGALLYAQPTDADGNFSIEGVPDGTYQLVIFDSALNIVIATKVLNVTASMELGEVPVNQWFSRLYNYVFDDTNENGFRDAGEAGIPEQAINIRWRDGSMYQSMPTDGTGFVPFEQVFPFFSWLVAEVDFTRFKATGMTAVVDAGGNPTNTEWPGQVGADLDPKLLVPQPQSENGGASFRTETGPVLVEAFQGFLGQSNVLLWGKAPYAPAGSIVTDVNVAPFDDFPGPGDTDANANGAFDGDQFHGGISGIVHYSVTRAENDPRWGGPEVWEPGIADVTVQLWSSDRTKLLNEVTTDSWDASQPTGCQGDVFTFRGQATDCYDGLRNFNQVRPGVFDGGYAFMSQLEPITVTETANWLTPVADRAAGFRQVPIPAGKYIVRVVPPRGYKIVKEEDKNVDFGDEYIPQEFVLGGYALGDAGASAAPPKAGDNAEPLYAPFCVGSLHEVPAELALYPGVATAYGGDRRPTCDQKLVTLRNGQNPGANFFLFTEAPIAGHIMGFVLDDTANEFDPNSPQFGEKYAPPFMPISIRDWTGREITSTYTDAYGSYNALVPSTFTANQPIPSGMSPSMLTACINAATMVNGAGLTVPNPDHYKQYSQFCYTFNYMPGTTTYLDTPVMPTGAFTGTGQFPVDAEPPSQTPIIARVTNIANLTTGATSAAAQIGPYLVDRTTATLPDRLPGTRTIDITSGGMMAVPNPVYDGLGGTQAKTVVRDYTFGPSLAGVVVRLGAAAVPAANVTVPAGGQTGGRINVLRVVVPRGAQTNELTIERCVSAVAVPCTDWRKSVVGVTLTVATPAMHTNRPPVVKAANQTIQQAIDAVTTNAGDLVLVAPGTYEEPVVMSKPVRLQGWGALSTVINTVTAPAEKLQAWRQHVVNLLNRPGGTDYLLAGQTTILGAPPLATEGLAAALGGEAAGVTVFGRPLPIQTNGSGRCLQTMSTHLLNNEAYCLQNENTNAAPVLRANARIDGFAIIGAMNAAGIMVNANARNIDIGNNRITNNVGDFAGGIRVGHTGTPLPLGDENELNTAVTIHHNLVAQNAGLGAGGGGGIVIGTGANGYQVTDNFIAGNFTGGQGAGVAHIGRSPGGVIDRNTIVFNEGFNQGQGRSGGGIFIGGTPPAVGTLTAGSGSLRVSNNLIQGNHIASGDGGGVALDGVNGGGPDAANDISRSRVTLYNNMIANNVAGLAGGGVSLHDAAFVEIVHNTIVNNDSFGTAGGAFLSPDTSTAQPAGIVSRGHSPLLAGALGAGFSNPTLLNSIVWQNRSFYFGPLAGGVQNPADPAPVPVTYGLIPNATRPLWDLGVLGAAGSLNPRSSILTSTAGYHATNSSAAPSFVASYQNGSRNPTILTPEQTSILTPVAFDEGGTFIRSSYGPLTLQNPANQAFFGDYHVNLGVVGASLNAAYGGLGSVPPALLFDFDHQSRPSGLAGANGPHRGADQAVAVAPPQPGIVVTAPANNTTVGGTVTIFATVTAIAGVQRVDFLVNGVLVGSDTTAASGGVYNVSWNTATVPNSPPQALVTATVYAGAVVTTSPAVAVTVNNLGLVASYDFNEGSGNVRDGAVGLVAGDLANDGTLSGGVTRVTDRTGVAGGALLFDGVSGLVTVPDANSLDLTTAMTLEAWVNPSAANELWQTIVMKENAATNGPGYSLYGNSGPDGGPGTYVRPNTVSSDQAATSTTRLSAGAWRHVAATYGGGALRIYVDGALVASRTLSGALPNSASALFIGGNQSWGEFFAGAIDDVKIYRRALTAGEIAASGVQ